MSELICFHNPDELDGYLSNLLPSRFSVGRIELPQ